MIVKYNDTNLVYYMEAVGNGVKTAQRWSHLRKYVGDGKSVEYMAYRKVNYELSEKAAEDLDQFLIEIHGKAYGLGITKLIGRQQSTFHHKQEGTIVSKERTFFCSELIAKAFKVLGIIENDS
jgi:hypothetical protein